MKENYTFDYDGNLIIKRTEVLDDHLDACHNMRMLTPKTRKFGDHPFHHVASIPASVAIDWMKEGINIFDLDDEGRKKLYQKLNGETSRFKTIDARL